MLDRVCFKPTNMRAQPNEFTFGANSLAPTAESPDGPHLWYRRLKAFASAPRKVPASLPTENNEGQLAWCPLPRASIHKLLSLWMLLRDDPAKLRFRVRGERVRQIEELGAPQCILVGDESNLLLRLPSEKQELLGIVVAVRSEAVSF